MAARSRVAFEDPPVLEFDDVEGLCIRGAVQGADAVHEDFGMEHLFAYVGGDPSGIAAGKGVRLTNNTINRVFRRPRTDYYVQEILNKRWAGPNGNGRTKMLSACTLPAEDGLVAGAADGHGPVLGGRDEQVRVAEAHPFLPAVMLREIAEGGTHLDRDTMAAMAGLPRAFASVIGKGVQAGTMRPLNPLIAYFSTVAPIMLFTASAPIRKEMAGTQQLPFAMPEREAFITHVQHMLRRSLAGVVGDEMFAAAGIDPQRRPEELDATEWARLAAATGTPPR